MTVPENLIGQEMSNHEFIKEVFKHNDKQTKDVFLRKDVFSALQKEGFNIGRKTIIGSIVMIRREKNQEFGIITKDHDLFLEFIGTKNGIIKNVKIPYKWQLRKGESKASIIEGFVYCD